MERQGQWTTRCSTAILFRSDTLLAGTAFGVYRSIDQGITWLSINPGVSDFSVNCMATSGDTIYAGGAGVLVQPTAESTGRKGWMD